jgi:hypothetical protein
MKGEDMTPNQRLLVGSLIVALTAAGCGDGSADRSAPTPTARLELPIDGSDVRQCAVFTGTADLPGDKTLILSMRNLDNHDRTHYFSAVQNYEYPEELDTWTGHQWFGSGDSSVGQRYRVELLIVDLTLVQAALAAAPKNGWAAPQNPPGSTVAAHITLVREAGPGPGACS